MIRAVPAVAALLLAAAPAMAAPATLACVATHGVNWRAESPVLVATAEGEEPGAATVHLDPRTGEWFLSIAGSAALTQGGGTFDIERASDFAAYHHEWVGIDGDTMLRIWGGGAAPLRFVVLSRDFGVTIGMCAEPEETFIFLQPLDQP